MYGNDYSGGGGGFMPNSSPRMGSQGSPGGERRAATQSLRPVTIKQILGAEQAHADAESYIDSVEVTQVTVVASVISIQSQTTNSMYYIDDGTGRIEARLWTDSSAEDDDSNLNGVKEGTYVRVTGVLKNFSNKRYINANSVRPCTDAHELYFHMMEVMYVSLVHQRGPPPRPGEENRQNGSLAATATNGGATSNYSAYTSTSKTGANDQYAGLSALARRIIDFVVAQPPSEEGTHVAAIARHVQSDAASISTALDELMDNGHVFSTIDESHFSASG
ncbi:replication protein A, subunit RPA32 [Phellopilus nigrolimitatus]|nr:replication protein A, subunit RPA32 [Phellopilus nigrolimitatus]